MAEAGQWGKPWPKQGSWAPVVVSDEDRVRKRSRVTFSVPPSNPQRDACASTREGVQSTIRAPSHSRLVSPGRWASSRATFAGLCLVTQSCPTLCDPVVCSPPGPSVHGDSPSKSTGVSCHALLQATFPSRLKTWCTGSGVHSQWRYVSQEKGLSPSDWLLEVTCHSLDLSLKIRGGLYNWLHMGHRRNGRGTGRTKAVTSVMLNEGLACCTSGCSEPILWSWA